jgi:protein SCO1
MDRRTFFSGTAGAIAATALSATWISQSIQPAHAKRYPNVPVINQEGKQLRFYDDLIKNKIVLLNFMYVVCGDICPGMTMNLVKVQRELNKIGLKTGRDVHMYSFTLEPERDRPEALKRYAEIYNVQPGWQFFTGTKDDLELLRTTLKFNDIDPVTDEDRTQHIGIVRFGNDALDRWGACPALSLPERIVESVQWMLPMENKRAA